MRRTTQSRQRIIPDLHPTAALAAREGTSDRRELGHELKYDGFRFHARVDRGKVKLLTRTGLDWTDRYESTATAIGKIGARTAYIDGELCAINPDGTTSFAELQAATDSKSTAHLVYFAFAKLTRERLACSRVGSRPHLFSTKSPVSESMISVPDRASFSHAIGARFACWPSVSSVICS